MSTYRCPIPVTTNICFGGPDMRDACITCASTGQVAEDPLASAGTEAALQRLSVDAEILALCSQISAARQIEASNCRRQ